MGKCTGKPRGRVSWVQEERRDILFKHKDLFHKDSSAFYCVVIDEWIEKWGVLDLDIQPEEADPKLFELVDLKNIMDLEERNMEITRRLEYRRASALRIGAWARYQWGSKATDTSAIAEVLREMKELTATQPRRPRVIQYYQSKYYEEKMKSEFEANWETIKATPGIAIVNERNQFVEKKWAAETQEFKDGLVAEIEDNYKEALVEYKRRGEWDGTALSYYEVWNKSKNLLPGITDAIGKLFGGGVVMFVFGPSAIDGDIVVRRRVIPHPFCTGVIPNTKLSKTDLYSFDPQGFKAASTMCVRYGQAAFSSEFCKSRIVAEDDIQRIKKEASGDNEEDDITRVYESEVSLVPIGSPTRPESPSLDSLAVASPLLHPSQLVTTASSSTSPAQSKTASNQAPTLSPTTERQPSQPHQPPPTPGPLVAPDVLSSLHLPANQENVNMISNNGQSQLDLFANTSPEEIQSWLASANTDNMFDGPTMASVGDSLLNATAEDLEKLSQNPYYTHRVRWQNDMLDSGTNLFAPVAPAEDTPIAPMVNFPQRGHPPATSPQTSAAKVPPIPQLTHPQLALPATSTIMPAASSIVVSAPPPVLTPPPPGEAVESSNANGNGNASFRMTSAPPPSPRTALMLLPGNAVKSPNANGSNIDPKAKRPEPPTIEELDQPPVKRRKKSVKASVGLPSSELIAARKPSRNIVKPARYGEQEGVLDGGKKVVTTKETPGKRGRGGKNGSSKAKKAK